MTANRFELANNAAILLAAQTTKATVQTAAAYPNGPPTTAGDGVFLENSPKTLYKVDVREDVARRTVRVEVTVVDLLAVYTISVGGVITSYDATAEAPADLVALLEGIRDAIIANGPAAAIATATTEDVGATGAINRLTLKGVARADFSILVAATLTAELAVTAEAAAVDIRIFHLGADARWRQANVAFYPGRDGNNFEERFDTGGLVNGYVELDNIAAVVGDSAIAPDTITYVPTVTIAPAILPGA